MTGQSEAEILGRGWLRAVHPEDEARLAEVAVRLLGAQIVLSGSRPEVAVAFVTLGASLEGVVTCGTLEAGIAYAMGSAGGRQRDASGR